MKYLEFTFQTQPDNETTQDVLTAVLADVGFESFTNDNHELKGYIQASLFNPQSLDDAIRAFPLPDASVTYQYREAEDKDWNEVWEQNYFQPILVGDGRCVVHSTFHHDVPAAEYDIVINPQMAFGTGHHETTSLVMGQLLQEDLQGKTVLDMGCGTSILAILARMRGAKACTAIDIDDWCVRNSQENIALNGLDGITVELGDAHSLAQHGPFDVVIANINRNILLADMQYYVARMVLGSVLLISGFYEEDVPALRQEAERLGLQYDRQRSLNRWTMVRFVHP